MNIEFLYEFVRELFEGKEGSHDYEHVLRVVRNSKIIALKEGADPIVCEMLALVHDYGDKKLGHNLQKLSLAGLLIRAGVGADKAEWYAQEVALMSFSASNGQAGPQSLEGRVVQDADRLDAIGAIGIARCFAYGGHKGRSLRDSLKHFEEKLLLLEGLFNTVTGKDMAQIRHHRLQEFYQNMQEEL